MGGGEEEPGDGEVEGAGEGDELVGVELPGDLPGDGATAWGNEVFDQVVPRCGARALAAWLWVQRRSFVITAS